ncbi:hypothetical protein I5907_11780 [Panacibacter sp. DH6]|uniref:Uncharacterized protein n=1 Tax=Panacibacter microcysteis TaxID=2793269 RepID=A0A931EAR6_9BACT|nr:hypothetical protein [Panacibacter microcysteis]MBG9376921.1 hypothetical protein [Panacibacter microcysteis]
MSINQSNLSSSKYGYDIVVATTQDSINATMKQYYSDINGSKSTHPLPVITKYYGINASNAFYEMTEAEVLASSSGTDPFSVATYNISGTGSVPTDVNNFAKSPFAYGFKAQIGIPAGLLPAPDIVTLNPGLQSVTYNIYCATFQVVQTNFGRLGNYLGITNESQPASDPWMFTSSIPLKTITDETNLPPSVMAYTKTLNGAFSVQQLLLDLDNAVPLTIPTISGIEPTDPVYIALQTEFIGLYLASLKAYQQPVLNYAVTVPDLAPSTFNIKKLDMYADGAVDSTGTLIPNPTTDQQSLCTLNYLCSTNASASIIGNQFNWNWFDDYTQLSNYHGVVAVNKSLLVNYYKDILTPLISKNCYSSSVTCSLTGSLYSSGLAGNQAPTVTLNDTGSTVLTFSYNSSAADSAGANGDIAQMAQNASMNATVEFSNNQIIITQHLIIYVSISYMGSNPASGNIIDKTITDTYTLTVDDHGKMLMTLSSNTTDASKGPSDPGWENLNVAASILNQIQNGVSQMVSTSLTDISITNLQTYVFPGGNSFSFKDVTFSDNQDLISRITYLELT